MPTKDKLRNLLALRERKVPDSVRLKEMNEVRNYNRNQFQKVFDNEKRQVQREQESIQPASAKDVGSAFKLQVYILKMNQILQLKQETFQQLTNSMATRDDDTPQSIAARISRLRGVNSAESSLATSFFSKAELLAAYNEMMAFIKLFMPDLTTNNRQLEQIYAAYLTPLTDLLKQIQGLYPAFFSSLNRQDIRPAAGSNARKVLETVRSQCISMYSLLGSMAEFLDDENLRPITASDVATFIKDNNVRAIFVEDPLPPFAPGLDVNIREQEAFLDRQQQQRQIQQQAEADRQAAIAAEEAQRQQQAADLQRAAERGRMSVGQAVEAFVRRQQAAGVIDNQVFSGRQGQVFNAIRAEAGQAGNAWSNPVVSAAIYDFRQANPQFQAQRGPRPRGPQPPPPQPPPRQLSAAQEAFRAAGGVAGQQVQLQPIPTLNPEQNRIVLETYKQLEETGRRVINPEAHRTLYAALPQEIQDTLRRPQPDGTFDLEPEMASQDDLEPWIQNVRRIRQAWGNAQQPQVDSGELFGQGLPQLKAFVEKKGMFPSKMNPKHVAHFMKVGIPPQAIFKLMKKHGIRDGALMEEMEGSGIFDDIVHYGSQAFDAVKSGAKDVWKDVKDSVKDALPSMSDIRRGVSDIVPDQYKKHLPDALKTTLFDKAKNLFGFGATEAGGISNRHREPFSQPNLDRHGYRQGAAERMRIMPVDKEIVSGLHRLRGGDQLRDNDPEVLRRQDHHDIDVPAVQEQPIHGYGVDGDEDDQFQGGLKQRLMGMPLSMFAPRGGRTNTMIPMFSGAELDPYASSFEGGAESFYEEEEKPHDRDEDPTPFRVREENYKVNTGRLKKVSYKE